MNTFLADLHIHSRFSRATSKQLSLRNLAAWSRIKGLDVIATGDFTHPTWIAEIEEQLVPEGNGLFVLKDSKNLAQETPFLEDYSLSGQTRFMLCTEISSIYKRHGQTRKVHNLVFMPSVEMARAFNMRLGEVGNLNADGRPILGLDSRDLLEIVLETGPQAFVVPAHIWTPWFSLFGSKSGFDSVEECFGDLSKEIFALETGLSSDPEMNWLISALDRYRLISNSDAHSGEKLAREANIFSGEISYEGIYRALRGEGFSHKLVGTLEFFPEEGKYHLDGHRNCGVVLEPRETRACNNICPKCGKPLTVGVLHRVMDLADRGEPVRPHTAPDFTSLIPLQEVLGEILSCGPKTKKVMHLYAGLMRRFGSELVTLREAPVEEIGHISKPLAEGLRRMRAGEVIRHSGFDGQFGTISLFTTQEKAEITGGKTLIKMSKKKTGQPRGTEVSGSLIPQGVQSHKQDQGPLKYTACQKKAVEQAGPLLVVAGPGTGKTQTLMGRVEHLLENGVFAKQILVLTFTRRAADELQQRLITLRGEESALPRADTMHALAYECWTDAYGAPPTILTEQSAKRVFAEATGLTGVILRTAWHTLALCRERVQDMPADLEAHFHAYTKTKESWNLADYTDLLTFWQEKTETGLWPNPYTHILVDEVQDLTTLQLQVLHALTDSAGQGFFAIGDPNQSIYSFRGANPQVEVYLKDRWPELTTLTLTDNFRSAQKILDLAAPLVPDSTKLVAQKDQEADIRFFTAPNPVQEAFWIGEQISGLLGGTSHSLLDSAAAKAPDTEIFSPGDIAVLVRLKALIPPLKAMLAKQGLPCAVPEEEAFWQEPRMALLLHIIGRTLGIATPATESGDSGNINSMEEIVISEQVLLKGPVVLAAHLKSTPPFDHLFWSGPDYARCARKFGELGSWRALLNWVHLQSELDSVKAKAEKIQIITLHASKGLEFEAVFIPGLEQGILPFAGNDFLAGKGESELKERAHLLEEQRLFYVGLTRAKRRLYLSHSKQRSLYGKKLSEPASSFTALLPEKLMRKTKAVGRTVRKEKQINLLG